MSILDAQEEQITWNAQRYNIMEGIIRDKFRRSKQLRDRLITVTQDRTLLNTDEG